MQLHGQSVLVLGLGESGLAMARWCAREGAALRVADTRREPPHLAALAALVPYAEVRTGGLPLELLEGIDLVALSPGLAPSAPPQAALLEAARQRGVPVCGELALFQAKLASLAAARGYRPVVLAITGTNGKTTVTSLTGRLAARAGARVVVAGNIGPTTLDTLSEALDADELPSIWVIEASSFQLAHAGDFAPTAAAFLNLSEDHLDWHGSMAAYGAAKARILERATRAILNRDDAAVMRLGAAHVAGAVTFGLNPPEVPASFGVVDEEGIRWLAWAAPDEAAPRARRAGNGPAATPTCTVRRLMPVDALRMRGDHNAANALAALALCHAAGLALAPLLHGLRDYRGEPHRVELVQTLGAVEYFDDSKGTNVGATVAALEGLKRRVVLIAGGDGKGQDFTPLAAPIARHARAVVLIGKDRARLRAAVEEAAVAAGVEIVECASLEDAVECAASRAQPGDAVLLSPACASLDMFRNYKHRAEVFVAAVARLGQEAGAAC